MKFVSRKILKRALAVFAVVFVVFIVALYITEASLLAAAGNRVTTRGPYVVSADAAALHETLLVADLHCDVFLWNHDLLERRDSGHVDLPRMIEGNVALQGMTAATRIPAMTNFERTPNMFDLLLPISFVQKRPSETWTSPTERALYQAKLLHDAAERSEGQLVVIKSQSDLSGYLKRREKDSKISAAFLGIEGAHALGSSVDNIDVMFDAGYRMIGPTHFFDNLFSGSAHGLRKYGLSEFGEELVRRMESKGMLVDLSHASPNAIATKPVVVSHTGVRGTYDSTRNLSDKQLMRIKENGGLVGVGLWSWASGEATVEAVVAAIKYTSDLIGADHVALGRILKVLQRRHLTSAVCHCLLKPSWHKASRIPISKRLWAET